MQELFSSNSMEVRVFDQDGTMLGESPESPTKKSKGEKNGGELQKIETAGQEVAESTNYLLYGLHGVTSVQKTFWVFEKYAAAIVQRVGGAFDLYS